MFIIAQMNADGGEAVSGKPAFVSMVKPARFGCRSIPDSPPLHQSARVRDLKNFVITKSGHVPREQSLFAIASWLS
jgi:hypothetical protein